MDFLALAKDRYSMRKFDGRPLSQEDIDKILEAGIVAPTAKNLQPFKIFVVKSDESLKKLKRCTHCDFGTKTAFFVCYDKEECWIRETDGENSGFVDGSIVTTHMMLEAASIGVGSTWVMWFDADKARLEFSLPENLVPVAFLVCGYPSEDAEPSSRHFLRKAKDDVVEFI